MTLVEVTRALRQLRVSGMAATLESRIVEAQADESAPLDFIATLVQDELQRRQDRLFERRVKRAEFRDAGRTLDTFDFDFNRKLDRRLVFDLAAGHFVGKREDVLFLGPPGTGKSHLAQAIGHAVIQQGHKVLYREAHMLLEDLTEATIDGNRKARLAELATVPLLIIDDRGSTLITSNRPVDDWGKLLGDAGAVTATIDRLLHHAHVLKCGPRSWRTRQKLQAEVAAE